MSRRMIVVVITDEAPVTTETERMLRRLRVQHDVLWLTVSDADPVLDHATATIRSDVDSMWEVPDFVQGDPDIIRELAAQTEADAACLAELLKRMEISPSRIGKAGTAHQSRAFDLRFSSWSSCETASS